MMKTNSRWTAMEWGGHLRDGVLCCNNLEHCMLAGYERGYTLLSFECELLITYARLFDIAMDK